MGGILRLALLITLPLTFFILGWTAAGIMADLGPNVQQPLSLGDLFSKSVETAPKDHISEDQIHVFKDRVLLDIPDVTWSSFTATDSMIPFLDENSNGLEVVPQSPEEIDVGDIISYESDYSSGIVIHRVVEKSKDELGTYYILKGDNNPAADPGRVRFEQIKGILVGVLY